MVFCPFIFIFIFILLLFRRNVRTRLIRATSATVMVIFSKVLLRRLLYHSYVKVSFRELLDTLSILKDTLWLKILWTWIKIRANSFIKTLVNNMKRKTTKVPWTLSLTKKKCDSALQRTLYQNRYFTCCYTFLFLSSKPSF